MTELVDDHAPHLGGLNLDTACHIRAESIDNRCMSNIVPPHFRIVGSTYR
jgi:hypothetical protein